ncbi:MAG: hypothetical protein RLY93_02740 [Sumerlaeia bacterium]
MISSSWFWRAFVLAICLSLSSMLGACSGASASQAGRKGLAADSGVRSASRPGDTQALLSDPSIPIELPENYNENNYRRLKMAVFFNDVSVRAGEISPDIVETVSARLQTEMAELKRFTIESIHNRGGMDTMAALHDIGEANLVRPSIDSLQATDLVLSAAVTLTREHHEMWDHDKLIYEVEVDFNCEDVATRTVAIAGKAKGQSVREQALTLKGSRMGGYSDEDERQAIYNACMLALANFARQMGGQYPVGGRVTGMLGNRMTVDRGFEHGITKGMPMVIYTTISGVDLPLAVASATPSEYDSNLVVQRWEDRDPYAVDIVSKMRQDPNWLRTNTLHAVALTASVPPKWEDLPKAGEL